MNTNDHVKGLFKQMLESAEPTELTRQEMLSTAHRARRRHRTVRAGVASAIALSVVGLGTATASALNGPDLNSVGQPLTQVLPTLPLGGVPALPLGALPNLGVPSIGAPALPSLSDLPVPVTSGTQFELAQRMLTALLGSLPSGYGVPGLSVLPKLPGVADLPGIPELPQLPLPKLPVVGGGSVLPKLPVLGGGSVLPALPKLPVVGGGPVLPALPKLPVVGGGPVLPALPKLPALGSLPITSVLPNVQGLRVLKNPDDTFSYHVQSDISSAGRAGSAAVDVRTTKTRLPVDDLCALRLIPGAISGCKLLPAVGGIPVRLDWINLTNGLRIYRAIAVFPGSVVCVTQSLTGIAGLPPLNKEIFSTAELAALAGSGIFRV